MGKLGAYKNRILYVNLTSRIFEEEALDPRLIREYIGGRGFGVKLLYDSTIPGIDPLGENNMLIFTTGPLAGTNAQCASRWKVTFKSPLTGAYGMSSCGGHWAVELKRAGFDAVVVTGRSEEPVYVWINNGHYEFRDATYLWGLQCSDTHELIREELRDSKVRIACIGPAGERQVKFAGIFSDRRAAGRTGAGAVMGSKNLKAIATRGSEPIEVSDGDRFKSVVRDQIAQYKSSPAFHNFSRRGTQATQDLINGIYGMYPTRNFQTGFLSSWHDISSTEYDKIRVRKVACYSCFLHCASITKIGSGQYAGAWSEGPEYETIWAFTGSIGASDIGLTVAADRLCDELGLDTISTGNAIGFAYELFERELITLEDTGGLELVFGNTQPVLKLIHQIAYREGFGNILAEGVRNAAQVIGKGADQFAIHCKGLELPGYDPRGAKAHGLNLMTANMGADHCSGFAAQELFWRGPGEVSRLSLEDKGVLTKWNQDLAALAFTGIICAFNLSSGMMTPELYSRLITSATGVEEFADVAFLWKTGERIFNLERMFNVREGFGKKNDTFPVRLVKERLPDGDSAGQVFEADQLLANYYEARGWDTETGIPKTAKLKELGLT